MRIILIVFVLGLCGSAALAEQPGAGSVLPIPPAPPFSPVTACENAIGAAQWVDQIPAGLLRAIGVVESGRADPAGRARPWPWTIDVDGAGQFFASKAEAIAAVEALEAKGVQSIDVGCLQVNLMHHPHAFPSLDAAFDPATNVAYGASFLRALFRLTGNWTIAAADYHSQTAEFGLPYARQVMLAWGHPELAPAVLPVPPQSAPGGFALKAAIYAALPPASAYYRAFAPMSTQFGAFAQTAANSGGHALRPLAQLRRRGHRAPVETAQAPN